MIKCIIVAFILILLGCENINYDNNHAYEDIIIDMKDEDLLKLEKKEEIKLSSGVYNIDDYIISGEQGELLVYIDSQQGIVGKINLQSGQIVNIGNRGRGPFEYFSPSFLREYKTDIYVWDASGLKFIVYDEYGNPIREGNTLNRAISKFDVINEDSLVIKMSGGFEGESIGIFSFSYGNILEESLTGIQNNNDLLLELLAGTSGVLAEPSFIYYALPSKLAIHKLNLISNEKSRLLINSPYFKVENFEGSVKKLVNTDRDVLIEYLFNNSATNGLYKYENTLILKTINGLTDANNKGEEDVINNRYYTFYIINK